MNEAELNLWMSAKTDDPEIPAWKALDIVTRQWAVMSQWEKDQSNYAKMKEFYA
jgi:uncharacterized membrane-anchored protein